VPRIKGVLKGCVFQSAGDVQVVVVMAQHTVCRCTAALVLLVAEGRLYTVEPCGTVQRTYFIHPAWDHLQVVLVGCWSSWLRAVAEHRLFCVVYYLLMQNTVYDRIFIHYYGNV
jgi:hypothetical protein